MKGRERMGYLLVLRRGRQVDRGSWVVVGRGSMGMVGGVVDMGCRVCILVDRLGRAGSQGMLLSLMS